MSEPSPRDGRSLVARARRGEPSRSGRATAGAATSAAEARVSQCYGTRDPRGVPALLVHSRAARRARMNRSEEHTSELQSQSNLVCRLLLEKKKKNNNTA